MNNYDYYGVDACAREAERVYNRKPDNPVEPDYQCRVCKEESGRLYHGVCKDCLYDLYQEHKHEMYDFFKDCDPEEYDPDCPAPLDVMWNGERYEFDAYLEWFALDDEWTLAEYFDEKGWIDESEDEWYKGEH